MGYVEDRIPMHSCQGGNGSTSSPHSPSSSSSSSCCLLLRSDCMLGASRGWGVDLEPGLGLTQQIDFKNVVFRPQALMAQGCAVRDHPPQTYSFTSRGGVEIVGKWSCGCGSCPEAGKNEHMESPTEKCCAEAFKISLSNTHFSEKKILLI